MTARVVLLDAMGTLLRLEPPVPPLVEGLAAEGRPVTTEVVAAALAAEIRFYRANYARGRDRPGLEALRRECAAVLAAGLPDPPPPDRMVEILLSCLRFTPFPEVPRVLDRLRADGHRIAVVSNWDCGLVDHLRELDLLDRVDDLVMSAPAGFAKPDPRIFRLALERLAAPPESALHVGDDPVADLRGAREAGLAALLVDRDGRHPEVADRIADLDGVLAALA